MTISINIITIMFIVIISFFFKQIKKKGDSSDKVPRLVIKLNLNLIIGKDNNVNNNANVNIKK